MRLSADRKSAWNGLSRFNAGSAGSRTIDARAIGTRVRLRANKARLNRVHWAGAGRRRESPDLSRVKPKLVAEVKFTEWTAAGEMRHPVFVGLRTDKKASVVFPRITETARGSASLMPVLGIREAGPHHACFLT
jgi:ATP-dependent DNA ligase